MMNSALNSYLHQPGESVLATAREVSRKQAQQLAANTAIVVRATRADMQKALEARIQQLDSATERSKANAKSRQISSDFNNKFKLLDTIVRTMS